MLRFFHSGLGLTWCHQLLNKVYHDFIKYHASNLGSSQHEKRRDSVAPAISIGASLTRSMSLMI